MEEDTIAAQVGQLLYERGSELYRHLPDLKFPKPADHPPPRAYQNPFTHSLPSEEELYRRRGWVSPRAARLKHEPVKIYDALAFAMWRFGLMPNCHITISFKKLGIHRERRAVALFSKWNKEAKRWLKDDKPRKRWRRTPRFFLGGGQYFHVYALEEGPKLGFHIHQLAYVPHHAWKEFEFKMKQWFSKQLGVARLDPEAIFVRTYFAARESDGVIRTWDWFRYLIKGLSEDQSYLDTDGKWHSARSIFKPYRLRKAGLVDVRNMAGVSENIGKSARESAQFQSRFRTGEWHQLYDGRELEEGRQERARQKAEHEMQEMLRTLAV